MITAKTVASAAFAITLATGGLLPMTALAAGGCPTSKQLAASEGGAATHGAPAPQYAASGGASNGGAPGNVGQTGGQAQYAAAGSGDGAAGGAATKSGTQAQYAAAGSGDGAAGAAATKSGAQAQFASTSPCP